MKTILIRGLKNDEVDAMHGVARARGFSSLNSFALALFRTALVRGGDVVDPAGDELAVREVSISEVYRDWLPRGYTIAECEYVSRALRARVSGPEIERRIHEARARGEELAWSDADAPRPRALAVLTEPIAPQPAAPRPSATSRGYGAEHRQWRTEVLARERECRDPARRHVGRVKTPTTAAYIVPLRSWEKDAGAAALELAAILRSRGVRVDDITALHATSLENGEALCRACAAVKTAVEKQAAPRPPANEEGTD